MERGLTHFGEKNEFAEMPDHIRQAHKNALHHCFQKIFDKHEMDGESREMVLTIALQYVVDFGKLNPVMRLLAESEGAFGDEQMVDDFDFRSSKDKGYIPWDNAYADTYWSTLDPDFQMFLGLMAHCESRLVLGLRFGVKQSVFEGLAYGSHLLERYQYFIDTSDSQLQQSKRRPALSG